MTRKRKRYTSEFKIEALRLVRESGKPVMQIARELGIQADLLHSWKRQAEKAVEAKGAFPGNGVLSAEAAENQRLRRELERVTQERDFLKKAAAYFAQESE
ncbi:MAG TPA: transposase [Longimicrobiales bacterium]|nr:transposase [Longimicrobiales bacterium]